MSATPPWIAAALAEIGQAESRGETHNPRILAYHARTTLAAKADEVPWCASFVSWALEEGGQESARSARALDYAEWGQALAKPVFGCVVVLRRIGGGHVGFWMGERDGKALVLGGNQSNRVSVAPYALDDVASYRWPAGLAKPEPESVAEVFGTGTGRAAAGVAMAVATVTPVIPLLQEIARLPAWMGAALTVGVAIGVAGWFIARRLRR